MISISTFCEIVASLPGVIEQPHFEKRSFRIKKKIFATLDEKTHTAVLKLSLIDQSVFCIIDKLMIYPVGGAWGKHGWTKIDLKKINKSMLRDMINAAYGLIAPTQFSENK